MFPELSGRTEMQNAVSPLYHSPHPTLQTGFQVTQWWDLRGELGLEDAAADRAWGAATSWRFIDKASLCPRKDVF